MGHRDENYCRKEWVVGSLNGGAHNGEQMPASVADAPLLGQCQKKRDCAIGKHGRGRDGYVRDGPRRFTPVPLQERCNSVQSGTISRLSRFEER